MFRCMTLGIAVSAVPAMGQPFNIDHGGSTPPPWYGAAASQGGIWNPVGVLSNPLVDIYGNSTPVLYSTESGGVVILDVDGATPNDKILMDSALTVSPTSVATVIWNLDPGDYDLYVYCWAGSLLGPKDVTIRAFTDAGQVVGGVSYGETWPGGHVLGETYDRLRVEVVPGGNQYLSIFIQAPGDFNVINGIQLVPVPTPGAAAMGVIGALFVVRRRR